MHLDVSSCALFTVYPNLNSVMAFNPSPDDKPPDRGRAVGKYKGTKQKWPREIQPYKMNQGSPLLPIFRALSRSLHRHPSAAQGHLHTIHPTA